MARILLARPGLPWHLRTPDRLPFTGRILRIPPVPDVPELTAPITVTQEQNPISCRRRAPLRALPEPTPVARAAHVLLAAMAIGALVQPSMARAQLIGELDHSSVRLRADGLMRENLLPADNRQVPTFVFGEQIEGKADGKTVIKGQGELRRHDTVIRADQIDHDQNTGDTQAQGAVRIHRNGDRFSGPRLEMNVNTDKGFFEQPEYRLLKNEGTGDASRIDFVDKDRMQVHDGRYSTCARPPGSASWKPDWLVRAKRIDLDQAEGMGTAYSGVLEFKDVPILAAPVLSFPISDERKSGLLTPSAGVDSQNGAQIVAPYYFNLAPNYDLTLTPTLMSKRGLDLEGDFRYLAPSFGGRARAAVLPSDRLRDETRWFYSQQHLQRIPVSAGALLMRMDLNRVSDVNYWRDFDRVGENKWARLLPSGANLFWYYGRWVVNAGATTYQTLQDETSRIIPPFNQLPEVSASYGRGDLELGGIPDWEYQFYTGGSRFRRSFFDTDGSVVKDGGDRWLATATLTRRWQAPAWFVQPKGRIHAATYRVDADLGTPLSQSRVIPTLSLDSGLFFERESSWFGRSLIQTLEPRAFLTYTPYRDQSALPNYDSAFLDFNFASMFSEYIYGGNDRISDNKAITLGVSSRLLDPGNGAELIRLGLAQRYYFDDINVTLPGRTTIPKGMSDMLLAARVQWNRQWALDSSIQFNHETRESTRKTIGARYTPGDYKVLSAAYRVQRGVSEQLDLGWQWPLSDLWGSLPERMRGKAYGPGQWYSVGRVNYSIDERKPVEIIAGFEYDAGCWLGRVVLERQQTSATTRNQKIMFQLEFSGFASLGGNSLKTLGDNIPRYKSLRDGEIVPSRFENYD